MLTGALAAAALAICLAPAARAQAPTRPGLDLDSDSQAPASESPPQSTQLVQRDYRQSQGQTGQSAQAGPPRQQNEEFFYLEEGASGPDNLAGGLSQYNNQRMNQAGQQLRGNYGSLGQNAALPSGRTQDAWNRPFDNMSDGQSAPGTIRYQWSADLVMPVRLRAGIATSLVLPDWESAEDVVIGDGSAIEATILRSNQVLAKSLQTGLDTSLNITGGSGNVYTFYLRTEGRNTEKVTDLQVFVQAEPSRGTRDWFNDERRNVGEQGGGGSTADGSPQATGEDIALDDAANQGHEPVPVDRREFNLKMYEVNEGDRAIAPEYAYTDGRFTYLHFPAGMTDRPAVFRVVDGVAGRINTRVAGKHSEIIIVEAIGDLILQSGTRAVCVKVVDSDGNVANRLE